MAQRWTVMTDGGPGITENSHAFVVLPGGFGTMDELFEIVILIHGTPHAPAPAKPKRWLAARAKQ